MDTSKFQETELAEMRQLYQEELDKTLKRLAHIKGVLEKLGVKEQVIKIEVNTVETDIAQSKPVPVNIPAEKVVSANPIVKRKRKKTTATKSVWEDLLVKRLRALGKPLTYDQITDEVMLFGKIESKDRETIKKTLLNVITRLRRQKKKVDAYYPAGTKDRFIGLKRWFESPGELKPEYKSLLPKKPEKPVKRKRNNEISTIIKPVDSPTWPEVIIDILKKENRPLLVRTMAEISMKNFGVDEKYFDQTRVAIARCLTVLTNKDKVLKRHLVDGKLPGYYCFSEWFTKSGDLKKQYLDLI